LHWTTYKDVLVLRKTEQTIASGGIRMWREAKYPLEPATH